MKSAGAGELRRRGAPAPATPRDPRTRCSRARCRRRGTCPRRRCRRCAGARASRASRTSTPSMSTRPVVDVVEARQQARDRRLADAGRPRRPRRPRRRGRARSSPSSTGGAVAVREVDVLEAHLAATLGQRRPGAAGRRRADRSTRTSCTRPADADMRDACAISIPLIRSGQTQHEDVGVERDERRRSGGRRRARGGRRTRGSPRARPPAGSRRAGGTRLAAATPRAPVEHRVGLGLEPPTGAPRRRSPSPRGRPATVSSTTPERSRELLLELEADRCHLLREPGRRDVEQAAARPSASSASVTALHEHHDRRPRRGSSELAAVSGSEHEELADHAGCRCWRAP